MQKFLGENLEKLLALDNVVLHSSNLKMIPNYILTHHSIRIKVYTASFISFSFS